MILYYTFKKKTKLFAEVLGDVLGQPIYGLESDLNDKTGFRFMFSALMTCVTQKSHPVSNMPESVPTEIFVCSPIWGGEMAAPIKYFLENADLRGVKVNILLTASIPTGKHRQKALAFLNKIPCQPGEVYSFATVDKVMPDKDVLHEQLLDMLQLP